MRTVKKKSGFKLKYFHFCDFASVSEDGKTNVLGIFEKIIISEPTTFPSIFIAFAVQSDVDFDEILTVSVKDTGSTELFSAQFNAKGEIPKDKKQAILSIIVRLNNLPLNDFGIYKIFLEIGDKFYKEMKLFVEKP